MMTMWGKHIEKTTPSTIARAAMKRHAALSRDEQRIRFMRNQRLFTTHLIRNLDEKR